MDVPAEPSGSNDLESFSDPRRRSPRVPHRVPLAVTSGKSKVAVESIVVNAHGALVKSPASFSPGATLTVLHEKLARQVEAWVIWSGPGDTPGTFDVGIEFATPDATFWGPTYRAPARKKES